MVIRQIRVGICNLKAWALALQNIIVSLQSFIVGVNHPFIAPPHLQSLPYSNSIARPSCNIRPPTDPLLYAIHHTVLAMAISCKGQRAAVCPFRHSPIGARRGRAATRDSLKVPCSYEISAIGKFALLRYLSEFRFQILTAITSDLS